MTGLVNAAGVAVSSKRLKVFEVNYVSKLVDYSHGKPGVDKAVSELFNDLKKAKIHPQDGSRVQLITTYFDDQPVICLTAIILSEDKT